jgi:hypothetical protein
MPRARGCAAKRCVMRMLRTRPGNTTHETSAFGRTAVFSEPTDAVWASKCGESRIKLWELALLTTVRMGCQKKTKQPTSSRFGWAGLKRGDSEGLSDAPRLHTEDSSKQCFQLSLIPD